MWDFEQTCFISFGYITQVRLGCTKRIQLALSQTATAVPFVTFTRVPVAPYPFSFDAVRFFDFSHFNSHVVSSRCFNVEFSI